MIRVGSLVVILCSVIHCAWGIGLLVAPFRTTGIDLILTLSHSNHVVAGLIFISAGLLATVSTWSYFDKAIIHVLLFMPQQTLLFISMIGALQSMSLGRFADGVPRPLLFIFIDQIYLVVLCFFHIFAIIMGYGLKRSVRFV